MSDPTPRRREPGAHPIYLTPLGLHTRYMLGAYLRHTLMVVAALMTIALTIDLWPQVPLLTARGDGVLVLWDITRLVALRLPDLLPPFMPFAVFLGVVWSESAFTESRERMLIWNSGRSPLLCLTPALLAGLVMGVSLFVIDAYLRPAAIHVQMREVLGREGVRLDRHQSGGNHWIALPDGLLRAEIEYGPPLKLHNVTIYKLDIEGHLAEVNTASVAKPLSAGRWQLEEGRYWRADVDNRGDVLTTGGRNMEAEIPFRQRTATMTLNVMWLENLGLSPQYLALGDLRTLSRAHIIARDASSYRTRLQAVYAEPLFTCVMALLGAALAMLAFAYRTRWYELVGVLLAGYLAHFASRALLLMGEFGYVSSFLAGWLAAILVCAAVGAVLLVIQKRRGAGIHDTPRLVEKS
ncbi:MAG TPA: LptF/LptG family permease [Rhizomicrobium sp.]|jgi:lipopolysaccharide export LptBFGC system permease protein LptF